MARTAGSPDLIDEVKRAQAAYDTALIRYFAQINIEETPGAFLTDASFTKVNSLLRFLQLHPEVFPTVSREELAMGIENYNEFNGIGKKSVEPTNRINFQTKMQGKILHKIVLNVYNSAKNELKTGISNSDRTHVESIANDLKEMFEKGPATRRKNQRANGKAASKSGEEAPT